MIIHLNEDTRTDMAALLVARLAEGAGDADIKFYTGPMAASTSTAITTQTLLGTLLCSDPPATNTGPLVTFGPITPDGAADANGDAVWARIGNGDGVAVLDVDVTDEAGVGLLKLNTVTVAAGGPIGLDSLEFMVGG